MSDLKEESKSSILEKQMVHEVKKSRGAERQTSEMYVDFRGSRVFAIS